MELLIVRHGPAGDRAKWRAAGRPDGERPLTADGRRRTRAAARGLARLVGGVDLIATSPWTRARQTAGLIAEALGSVEVVIRPELVPDRDPADLLSWLKACREKRLVLVGHEPHLSRFASWLLTANEKPVLRLKKSSAVLLALKTPAAGAATLLWSVPPRALRSLGRG
ncbi:MAG: phosphohistidine phosphatase SixA [Elusimicrobia bacterium]|nr:phosphohistidine phosphatase SixA [Elusimicrobiota bacterium]MDE2512309.1 phosphohistidine phosphatase SixA [Elusimicrobiota bacterium]